MARGFFYTCTATHLTISLNKALRRGLLKPNSPSPGAAAAKPAVLFDHSVRWRLDRDDVSSTFVRLRGNLFTLFRWVHGGQDLRGASGLGRGPQLLQLEWLLECGSAGQGLAQPHPPRHAMRRPCCAMQARV